MGRQDFETETLLAIGGFPSSDEPIAIQGAAVRENPASGPDGVGVRTDGIAYTLEARSEVQAIAFRTAGDGNVYEEGDNTAPLTTATDPSANIIAFRAAGQDGFTPSDISPPLASTDGGGAGVPTIAFSSKDHGADAGDISHTLRSMGHDGSHANGGGQIAVAFVQNTRDEVRLMGGDGGDGGVVGALAAEPGAKQQCYVAIRNKPFAMNLRGREGGAMPELDELASVRAAEGGSSRSYIGVPAIGWSEELTASVDLAGTVQRGGQGGRHEDVMTPTMAVRRLTPMECERLQGFPDGFTAVLVNGKQLADGPRYKMCGNSFAVPCVVYVGQRIEMAHKMTSEVI